VIYGENYAFINYRYFDQKLDDGPKILHLIRWGLKIGLGRPGVPNPNKYLEKIDNRRDPNIEMFFMGAAIHWSALILRQGERRL
jgi:hypothetical protein